jgi:adenylate kinase
MKTAKLVFLGPPGAGKGTQAVRVSEELKVPHISTGDIFRKEIREKTPLGVEAKSYIDAGGLVPDSVTIGMVKNRLAEDDCKNGFLLDGFPRTIAQAEALATFAKPDMVINIAVADEKLMARLTGRRVCKECAGTFHVSSLESADVCPTCGGALYQRDDDKPETIKSRLDAYHAQTAPLIGFYTEAGALRNVDGDQKPDAVFAAVMAELKE